MEEKLRIPQVIVVEGRYDKCKIASIADAQIVTCDGFGVFKEKEKQAYLRRLAAEKGILVLTDADGGGLVIRNFLRGALPKEGVTHLYIPEVKGKEKRKKSPSKEGLLGVEGIEADRLREILRPFAAGTSAREEHEPITPALLCEWGLSGGTDSAEKRKKLAAALGLPTNLSTKALCEAMNALYTRSQIETIWEELRK